MGAVLGLLGGGGSILTVPIFVYLLGTAPEPATGASLAVVGTTALAGAFAAHRSGDLDLRAAFSYALPSLATVLLARMAILPALPDRLALGSLQLDKGALIMVLFALLMLAASWAMLRKRRAEPKEPSTTRMIAQGLGVGLLTGLVGAGGGFLWIPALVLFGGMEMKRAVGTSLAIIALGSAVGLGGDIARHSLLPWELILPAIGLALVGMAAGRWASARVDGAKLRPAFAMMVAAIGLSILGQQSFSIFLGPGESYRGDHASSPSSHAAHAAQK